VSDMTSADKKVRPLNLRHEARETIAHLSSFGQRAPERGCSRVLAIVYDNELTASMHVEILSYTIARTRLQPLSGALCPKLERWSRRMQASV
jgi:hypothetical protein